MLNNNHDSWITRVGLATMCLAVALLLFFAVDAYNAASADAFHAEDSMHMSAATMAATSNMPLMTMTTVTVVAQVPSATPTVLPTMPPMAGMDDPTATTKAPPITAPTMAPMPGMSGTAGNATPMVGMTMMPGMEIDSCANQPITDADRTAVTQLISDIQAQAAHFVDIRVALSEGYQQTTVYPIPGAHGPWGPAHFLNTQYTIADIAQGNPINPAKPGALVYFRMPNGQIMLLGEMFIAPLGKGPCLGGGLTMWHSHSNLCFQNGSQRVVGVTNTQDQCPPGSTNHQTADMMHVWVFDNPDGALAMDLTKQDYTAAYKQCLAGSIWCK